MTLCGGPTAVRGDDLDQVERREASSRRRQGTTRDNRGRDGVHAPRRALCSRVWLVVLVTEVAVISDDLVSLSLDGWAWLPHPRCSSSQSKIRASRSA